MGNWLKRFIIEFIARCIPKHGKRIIYITLCYLLWSNQQDKDTIINEMIEINNHLHLSKNDKPLKFVLELRELLLTTDDFKYVRELPREKMRTSIIRYMPSWLKYDTDTNIIKELTEVCQDRYVTIR